MKNILKKADFIPSDCEKMNKNEFVNFYIH
jgi:hypothetical protein